MTLLYRALCLSLHCNAGLVSLTDFNTGAASLSFGARAAALAAARAAAKAAGASGRPAAAKRAKQPAAAAAAAAGPQPRRLSMGVAGVPDVAVGAVTSDPVAAPASSIGMGLSTVGGAAAVSDDDIAVQPAAASGDGGGLGEGAAEEASICGSCSMDYLRGAVAAAASQQVDDIVRPPGTGRFGLAGELGPNAASSSQQQQQDPVAAAPGPGRDGVTVADYSRPTISTTWSSVRDKGWAGIGISTSLVAPTNPALVTTGTSLLQLCNGRLQVWTLNPETGLNESAATPAITMLQFLTATINSSEEPLTPSGNTSTYFYVDSAAMEVKGTGYAFAFTSAPRIGSDLATQTFSWWLAVIDLSTALNGLENGWTVFRFDPALPAASGASCTAPAKPQLSKIQLTSDYWGIYVTGILNCIQDVGGVRSITVRGPVIYAMDTANVFGLSGSTLTEVAVFSTADLVASLPSGTSVTTASFNQMQPSRPQSDEDAFVEGLGEEVPFAIFVGQVSDVTRLTAVYPGWLGILLWHCMI